MSFPLAIHFYTLNQFADLCPLNSVPDSSRSCSFLSFDMPAVTERFVLICCTDSEMCLRQFDLVPDKRPVFYSSKAIRDSSFVFITIGPYQAIGSPMGFPEISRNRTVSHPLKPEPDPIAKRTGLCWQERDFVAYRDS